MNYQKVLMKIYWHAGLKHMAEKASPKTGILNSLEKCGNFQRTYNFLLNSFHAILRCQIDAFFENMSLDSDQHHLDFLNTLSSKIEALYQPESSDEESDESSDEESNKSSEQTNGPSHEHSHNLLEPNEHRNESSVSDKQSNKSCKLSVEKIQVQKEAFIEIQSYVSVSSDSDNLHKRFDEFCQSMSEKDDTWLFWRQFITMSVLPYLGLYMSMWSENWDLRLASLKLMAPIFHAFHCSNYIKIIPNHLAEIKCLPSSRKW